MCLENYDIILQKQFHRFNFEEETHPVLTGDVCLSSSALSDPSAA